MRFTAIMLDIIIITIVVLATFINLEQNNAGTVVGHYYRTFY